MKAKLLTLIAGIRSLRGGKFKELGEEESPGNSRGELRDLAATLTVEAALLLNEFDTPPSALTSFQSIEDVKVSRT